MLKWIIGIVAVVVVAAGGYVAKTWIDTQKELVFEASLKDRATAIWYAEQVVSVGPKPDSWPTRAFLPRKTFEQIGQVLIGSEYVAPVGTVDASSRPEGRVHIVLRDFKLRPRDGMLEVTLVVQATYEPIRVKPRWEDAKVELEISAILVPDHLEEQADGTAAYFRLSPTAVAPKLSVGTLAIGAKDFISKIIAANILQHYGEKLIVPVAAVSAPLEVDTSFASEEFSPFSVSGGVHIATTLTGAKHQRVVSARYPLLTESGVWMLGGLGPKPAPAPLPTDQAGLKAWLEQHEPTFAAKLRDFQQKDDVLRVRVSKAPLVEIAEEIAHPKQILVPNIDIALPFGGSMTIPAVMSSVDQYTVFVTSRMADGIISKPTLMRDDHLGEISLAVTPQNQSFVQGKITFAPPNLAWTPGVGLKTTVNASAYVHADLHTHLSTAFVGGGLGADVGLSGQTSASVPIELALQKVSTPAGDAVVMQPKVGCVPIKVDIHPDTPGDLYAQPWIKVASIGVRLKRNIGGEKIAPSMLFSSLPQTTKMHAIETKPGETFRYGKEAVEIVLKPQDVVVDADGFEVTAQADILGVADKPDPNAEAARNKLQEALLAQAPGGDCPSGQEYDLLVGNVEIGPNNEIFTFIVKSYRAGSRVAEETKKEVDKFYHHPIDSIKDMPENVLREGSKGVGAVLEGAKNVGEQVVDTVKKCFGLCG